MLRFEECKARASVPRGVDAIGGALVQLETISREVDPHFSSKKPFHPITIRMFRSSTCQPLHHGSARLFAIWWGFQRVA